jgi:hypothetical protein
MSKTTIPAGGITDSAVTTAKINADAVDATKIADDAISEEHLDATAITGHTALAATPADTDEFLISDGGTLKRIDASYIGGGSWTLLETEDCGAGGATAPFTSMSSTYHTHAFLFDTVRTVVDNDNLRLMVINGNGDSEQIYYGYERYHVNESGSTGTSTGGSASTNPHNVTLFGSIGSGANEGCSGIMYFTGTQDSGDATLFWGNMNVFEHDNKYGFYQMHGRISNSVLPDIRFYGGGGNFEHGKIRLYGIK